MKRYAAILTITLFFALFFSGSSASASSGYSFAAANQTAEITTQELEQLNAIFEKQKTLLNQLKTNSQTQKVQLEAQAIELSEANRSINNLQKQLQTTQESLTSSKSSLQMAQESLNQLSIDLQKEKRKQKDNIRNAAILAFCLGLFIA